MIQRYKPALAWFASILLATGVFVYILLDRSPYPVRPIAIQARLGFTIVLPLIFTLILLALRIEGFKIGTTAYNDMLRLPDSPRCHHMRQVNGRYGISK